MSFLPSSSCQADTCLLLLIKLGLLSCFRLLASLEFCLRLLDVLVLQFGNCLGSQQTPNNTTGSGKRTSLSSGFNSSLVGFRNSISMVPDLWIRGGVLVVVLKTLVKGSFLFV